MIKIKEIKNKIRLLIKLISYLFPNILFIYSPIKIYEFKQILMNVKFLNTDIIIDIGCGEGLQTLIIGKKCKKIYGNDVSKKNIAKANIRADFIKK